MAATGSIASNLGVNTQKYSFMQNAAKPTEQQKKYTAQPGWIIGMVLVFIGSIGDFSALALAAESIVAPIGSITLVANVVFAHYWLKESINWRELSGTAMIVIGSVLSVAFGDHTAVSYTVRDLLSFYGRTLFIIYAIIAFSAAIYMFMQHKRMTPLKQKLVDSYKRYEVAYDASDQATMDYEDFMIVALEAKYKPFERFHPFSLCALSGILGAQSVMFGKAVSELISTTISGDNQLFNPLFYLFLIAMLACVFGQLHFLAIALNFFDALYVVPVFQCFFISGSTIGGACFFGEFDDFNGLQWTLFPLGFIITIGGVLILSTRKMNTSQNSVYSRTRDAELLTSIAEGEEETTGSAEQEKAEADAIVSGLARRAKRRVQIRFNKAGDDEKESLTGDEMEEDVDKDIFGPTASDSDAESEAESNVSAVSAASSDHAERPVVTTDLTTDDRPIFILPRYSTVAASAGPRPPRHPDSPVVTPTGSNRTSPVQPPASQERRVSIEGARRLSLSRRGSRTPDLNDSPQHPPATPPMLSRQGTLKLLALPVAQALTQVPGPPDGDLVSEYMSPPEANELTSKNTVLEKTKKYSSVAYHVDGITGMPIVSAIAHAYAIGLQESSRHNAQVQAANTAAAANDIEMQSVHTVNSEPTDPSISAAGVALPVAEPVQTSNSAATEAQSSTVNMPPTSTGTTAVAAGGPTLVSRMSSVFASGFDVFRNKDKPTATTEPSPINSEQVALTDPTATASDEMSFTQHDAQVNDGDAHDSNDLDLPDDDDDDDEDEDDEGVEFDDDEEEEPDGHDERRTNDIV